MGGRRAGLMVIVLVFGLSGLGSNPGTAGIRCVLEQDT